MGRNSIRKGWKAAADLATAPDRAGEERDRLAAEVAKQIWVANGGREWADSRGEGSLIALEMLILPHLNEATVRASAALRYLGVLEDAGSSADYEDAGSVEAERHWAEEYFRAAIGGAAVAATPVSSAGEPAGDRLERLRMRVREAVVLQLKTASIAAA